MASDVQSSSEHENLATLVTGILNDGQELFRQQVNLIRTEIKEDLRKTKEASIPLAAGLSMWAAFAIVGTVLTLAGGGLAYLGKVKFDSFNPLPDKSAEALKENLEWIAKPK